jgi:hypothetical protein
VVSGCLPPTPRFTRTDARGDTSTGRDPVAAPVTTAFGHLFEVEFGRAHDRSRTGDLVLGNPFEDDEET